MIQSGMTPKLHPRNGNVEMTKPIWEWNPTKAILHIALMTLTFPLAVFKMYAVMLTTLSINRTTREIANWVQNPREVLK